MTTLDSLRGTKAIAEKLAEYWGYHPTQGAMRRHLDPKNEDCIPHVRICTRKGWRPTIIADVRDVKEWALRHMRYGGVASSWIRKAG